LIKNNIHYTLSQCLVVHGIPESGQPLLFDITDSLIVFSSDKQKNVYRLVTFLACGEK